MTPIIRLATEGGARDCEVCRRYEVAPAVEARSFGTEDPARRVAPVSASAGARGARERATAPYATIMIGAVGCMFALKIGEMILIALQRLLYFFLDVAEP
jgi:hypothetical protein